MLRFHFISLYTQLFSASVLGFLWQLHMLDTDCLNTNLKANNKKTPTLFSSEEQSGLWIADCDRMTLE